MPINLTFKFAALIIAALAIFSLGQDYGLYPIFEYSSVIAFTIFVALVFFVTRDPHSVHWQEVCLATGVPLGLLIAVMGFHYVSIVTIDNPDTELKLFFLVNNIAFITVLYGGIVSAVGYFSKSRATQTVKRKKLSLSKANLISVYLVAIIVWVYGTGNKTIFWDTINTSAIAILIASILLAFWFRQEVSFAVAGEATIFSSLLTMVMGIAYWFSFDGESREAINLMMCGLTYGLSFYLFLYFQSLTHEDQRFVDTGKANWHWLEISAFLIFMFFAPQTVRETYMNIERADTIRIDHIEEQLAAYEARIALLETGRSNPTIKGESQTTCE